MKRRVGALADAEIRTDAKAVDVGEGADVTKIAASLLAFFLSLFALPSTLLALPTEYTPLEGLEFNGKRWIATGYCPTASDRFECDVTVADAQVNASSAVFGTVRVGEPAASGRDRLRRGRRARLRGLRPASGRSVKEGALHFAIIPT